MSDPQTTNPRAAGGWRWLLVVSLAINLAVAGLFAGWVITGRAGGPPRGFDLAIGPFARALDREDRRWIMRELTEGREAHAPRSAADRAADRQAIVAAVSTEPFDAAALGQAMDEMRERGDSLQRATQAALVARIAAMTPEQRAAFAARLATELDGPPGP
jgi:uncharacterized membrane protein